MKIVSGLLDACVLEVNMGPGKMRNAESKMRNARAECMWLADAENHVTTPFPHFTSCTSFILCQLLRFPTL